MKESDDDKKWGYLLSYSAKFTLWTGVVIVFPSLLSVIIFAGCNSSTTVSTSNDYSVNIKTEDDKFVPFCDLTRKADEYNGKTVQTSAILLIAKETSILYDFNCSKEDQVVWYKTEGATVYKKLYPYLLSLNKGGEKRLVVDVVGEFRKKQENEPGFGHLNSYKYLFVISEVQAIKSDSLNIPFPTTLK
jgi:hypothetical protein